MFPLQHFAMLWVSQARQTRPGTVFSPYTPATTPASSNEDLLILCNDVRIEEHDHPSRLSTLRKHVRTPLAQALRSAINANILPAAHGGYTAKNETEDKRWGSKKRRTLEELVRLGFQAVHWNGFAPRPLVDAAGRVFAVLAGQPRHATAFPRDMRKHRRGLSAAVNVGLSYGKGQRVPGCLKTDYDLMLDRLLNNPAIERMATFASDRSLPFRCIHSPPYDSSPQLLSDSGRLASTPTITITTTPSITTSPTFAVTFAARFSPARPGRGAYAEKNGDARREAARLRMKRNRAALATADDTTVQEYKRKDREAASRYRARHHSQILAADTARRARCCTDKQGLEAFDEQTSREYLAKKQQCAEGRSLPPCPKAMPKKTSCATSPDKLQSDSDGSDDDEHTPPLTAAAAFPVRRSPDSLYLTLPPCVLGCGEFACEGCACICAASTSWLRHEHYHTEAWKAGGCP
ncbi:hypothetical protein DFH09DRAFT_1433163 [Mycena vulgaris]|nr:hypothetical protein DFH09DRAFT_1433163 [Mycena vulgaris]